MKQFFIMLLLLPVTFLQAQTKKIAFKSHSGSAENFAIALENDLFDMDGSNFGQAPERDIKSAQLDSVIFVSDTVTLLVTSVYCSMTYKPKDNASLWRAGREIALYHPLFSRKHSLDSIKRVIKEQYNFKNAVEKVIFIGYDNNRSCDSLPAEVSEPITFIKGKSKKSQSGSKAIWIVAAIVGISLLAGLMNRKMKALSLSQDTV